MSLTNTAASFPCNYIPIKLDVYAATSRAGLFKSFELCGDDREDVLFFVEVYHGLGNRELLGARPGLLLHNGKSEHDAVVAAAGDESFAAATILSFNVNSVIQLPQLGAHEGQSAMATETMRAGTVDGTVTFRFAIEVGEQNRRETFEWRKLDKDRAEGYMARGFKLMRLASPNPVTERATNNIPQYFEDCEIVGMALWSTLTSYTRRELVIKFRGSGRTGELGRRWELMVVITAMRILMLHSGGRTSDVVVGISEKIRGKLDDNFSD